MSAPAETGLHRRRIFSIPSGAPFLETFSQALLSGRIIEGFPGSDPFALADARIFIPTRRAARALTEELARQREGSSLLLPHIIPLGFLEDTADEIALAPHGLEDARLAGLAPPVHPVERRLRLARLIFEWARALRGAVRRWDGGKLICDETELNVVTASSAQAWHLAGELSALIDEMTIENISPDAFKTLLTGDLEQYWQITLQFLEIAFQYWPRELSELGLQDVAARQAALVDLEIARLASPAESLRPAGPHIVLGSTGTNAATARLIAAIARAPNGAVVLPGYDAGLDQASWDVLGLPAWGEGADPSVPAHPQAALYRLLRIIDARRDDIVELGAPRERMRMDFLREAMRPAATTHGWMQWRKRNGGNLREALANVSLIEAADERQEALAIALVLREALEDQTATAALVTPDRALSRRVRAELMRWNIAIDDSAGDPLALTQAGNLATLALAAAQPAAPPSALQALLDHDAISLGYERGEFIRLRMLASLALFRGLHADISNPAATIAAARSLAEDPHAHTCRKRIAADDWPAMQDLLERLRSALAPLRAISAAIPLTDWMRAHEAVLNELTRPADAGDMEPAGVSEDMQALRELFAGFHRAPQQDLPCMSADYASILATLMRETIVRGPRRAHPRLKILGLLEARLLEADVTVLGGLAETIWPPAARTNALLNRQMRAQLGLSSPERRTGQTAHDFVQAMGARRVVLSHARKTGGSPASPSRFLLRMAALAGETAWQECKTLGKNWLDLAGHLDSPERLTLISHPLPRPALALRPQKLSVTAIETWRRDPYSIYAEHILKLTPLDDIDLEEGAAAVGTMLHAALAEFHREFPSGPLPAHAIERLHEHARHAFAPLFVEPDFAIFKWPRWRKALADFVQWDRERRESNARIFAEIRGELQLPLSDGAFFTLTARADRIEHSPDGSVAVCDYKTGSPPSAKQVQSGLSPQLTLEAIMVRDGAFQQIAKAARVDEILYLKISGSGNFEAKDPSQGKEKFNIGEVASKHELGLRELAFQFRDEQTPYLARPVAQFAGRWLRYDHLSRYKEWSAIDGGEE